MLFIIPLALSSSSDSKLLYRLWEASPTPKDFVDFVAFNIMWTQQRSFRLPKPTVTDPRKLLPTSLYEMDAIKLGRRIRPAALVPASTNIALEDPSGLSIRLSASTVGLTSHLSVATGVAF